jgi:hypothetical protein
MPPMPVPMSIQSLSLTNLNIPALHNVSITIPHLNIAKGRDTHPTTITSKGIFACDVPILNPNYGQTLYV